MNVKKYFLGQIAEHYLQQSMQQGDSLMHYCFVFPNRRSVAFFKKWMAEAVREHNAGPVVAPYCLTINDLFAKASGLLLTDRISLLVKLYSCYRKLYPQAESLDDFVFWGDVILSDFNDVDKYLVDAKSIFRNISEFREIKDDFSYLTETQRGAIESFLKNFAPGSKKSESGRDVKENFREIWDILYPLYASFNALLESQGLSYEGGIYRKLANRCKSEPVSSVFAKSFPHTRKFVFAGLNALNECEKTVLRALRNAGMADFCWDYFGDMISDSLNRSSLFMKDNLKEFPQAFALDEGLSGRPKFHLVSVPSSVGQVKLVNNFIKNERPDDCAVVLPDESLLIPLLNSLDPQIEDINVTMGYSLASSELYALMKSISKLHLHMRIKDGEPSFWHKPVHEVLSNGLLRRIVAASESAQQAVANVKKTEHYIKASVFAGDDFLSSLFRAVCDDISSPGSDRVITFALYQQTLIEKIAGMIATDKSMALELELAREYWCRINSLSGIVRDNAEQFNISIQTYLKLLDSLLSSVSVPFNGEPLKGLQIMGPLETRCLDFKKIILLSCNEGVFPGNNSGSSFIPSELRKGFDLPTSDYREAMWAYYFYRMISRASDVTLVFDSRTEGVKSGEESRFIKQLEYHFGCPVDKMVATSEIKTAEISSDVVEKRQDHIDKLKRGRLSVSSVQNYMDCPVKFYYSKVLKLKSDDELSDNMDAGMLGNVYHNTMRALYIGEEEMLKKGAYDKLEDKDQTRGLQYVSRDYISSWLKRKKEIKEKIISLVCAETKADEVSGRDLVSVEVILEYVLKTLQRDLEILQSKGVEAFEIIGLELKMSCVINGFKFFGVLDRVDKLSPNGVRVSDYKSGKDNPSVLEIDDKKNTPEAVVDKIMSEKSEERHPYKAGLQFYIYDQMLIQKGLASSGEISNTMYSALNMFSKAPEVYRYNYEFAALMKPRLDALLDEIADLNIPFRRCEETEPCEYCDFKMICGR